MFAKAAAAGIAAIATAFFFPSGESAVSPALSESSFLTRAVELSARLPRNENRQPYFFRKPVIVAGAAAPEVTARAAAIYDLDSDSFVWAHGETTRRPLASLTKLATALAAAKSKPDWDGFHIVENFKEANGQGSQTVYPGDKLSLHDALAATLVASDNLAAANLLPWIKADLASADHSLSLQEPTGLNPENVGSLENVMLLARDAWNDPLLRDLSDKASYDILINGKKRTLQNTNPLLASDPFWLASKTGYIPESGGNVVAIRQLPDGHQILIGVMGSDDHATRFKDLDALRLWAEKSLVW